MNMPPPTASPWTIAIVGLVSAAIPESTRLRRASYPSASSRVLKVRNWRISVPLVNARSPAPRSTTTRTPGSRSRRSQASWSASYIAKVIALRASGRLMVTTATAPSCSRRRWSVIPAGTRPPRPRPEPGGARPWREAYPSGLGPNKGCRAAGVDLSLTYLRRCRYIPSYCDSAADGGRHVAGRDRPRRRSHCSPLQAPSPRHGPDRDVTEARAPRALERGRRMLHFTIDGFQGFRSRFDDVPLIQEVLEEVPTQLGLKPVMPAFVLPDPKST